MTDGEKTGTEQVYSIRCKGRSVLRMEVLKIPVDVKVKISGRPESNTISSLVECPHNTGAYGERCKALSAYGGTEGICPYVVKLPDTLDRI
jgi:hypothetical protein